MRNAKVLRVMDSAEAGSERTAAIAVWVANALTIVAAAAVLLDMLRRQGTFAFVFAACELLVLYANLRWMRRLCKIDTVEHLLENYPKEIKYRRARALWSMAVATVMVWGAMLVAIWLSAEKISAAVLLPYGMVLLGLMMALGLAVTVFGVAYAIWQLTHTR